LSEERKVVGVDLPSNRGPGSVGCALAWSRGGARAAILDRVEDFLLGEDAYALQELHHGRVLPHAGDRELLDGDEAPGWGRRI